LKGLDLGRRLLARSIELLVSQPPDSVRDVSSVFQVLALLFRKQGKCLFDHQLVRDFQSQVNDVDRSLDGSGSLEQAVSDVGKFRPTSFTVICVYLVSSGRSFAVSIRGEGAWNDALVEARAIHHLVATLLHGRKTLALFPPLFFDQLA
jgi:hypothetical protein